MKRTCAGCKALSMWTYGCKCWLGYKQKGSHVDPKPAEECPKPRTYADYNKVVWDNEVVSDIELDGE